MAASTMRPSPTLLCTGKSMRVLEMEKIMENKNPHSDKQTKTQLKEKQIKSLNIILKKSLSFVLMCSKGNDLYCGVSNGIVWKTL